MLREDHGQRKKGELDAGGERHRWSQPQALQLHDCHRMLKKSVLEGRELPQSELRGWCVKAAGVKRSTDGEWWGLDQ